MVAKRAAEDRDLEDLKRSKPAMTPEQNALLLKIAEDQTGLKSAVQNLTTAQENRDKEVLSRLTALEEEMAMTINVHERLAQLEADMGNALQAITAKTVELDGWQNKAMKEFETLHGRMTSVLQSMQEADKLFHEKSAQ